MKKLIISTLFITFSSQLMALDPSGGAGDVALLGELKIQTSKMLEELKTVKDTLDISRRMEDMQQLKVIKQMSAEGEALSGILNDAKEGQRILDQSKGNAFNQDDIASQIEYLEAKAESSDNPQAYAKMLADLKRIRFLGQANDASIKKITEGTNETDDIKTTAVSVSILAQVEANRAADETLRKNADIDAIQQITGNSGYSELYESEQ